MLFSRGNADPINRSAPGTYEDGQRNLVVFLIDLPHWGIFRSMEFQIFKDGSLLPCDKIATRTIGISERTDSPLLALKFQCLDKEPGDVRDHTYEIQVTVEFVTANFPPMVSDAAR